jgi:hypothetical protein
MNHIMKEKELQKFYFGRKNINLCLYNIIYSFTNIKIVVVVIDQFNKLNLSG